MDIYGTGGMILQEMKDLLVHMPGIRRLELIDLELDGFDVKSKPKAKFRNPPRI